LPAALVESLGFPELEPSLAMLHEPPAEMSVEQLSAWDHPAQHRLVCEELIAHYLSLSQARMQGRKKKARVFEATGTTVDRFLQALPFDLTGAQVRVIREAEDDLCSGHPMMRLVHGDVGSGKTVVAACCSLSVLADGWQVALMAPTELLAEQHHSNFSQWLEPLGMTVGFLSGNQPEKVRKETLELIRSGSIGVVVGTHALFQQAVSFSRLGLVIIDEQHRFGVDQRLALRDKGQVDGYVPHQLVMTATPIPRTLAMLRFADLDVSVIDELPPGRKPVKTSVIPASRREEVIDRISVWIAGGRQAYWVCTLIEESEFLQCEAAEKTAANLGKALSGIRVGLVHGRMPAMEKDAVMQLFKQHRYDLLVATTVIEVGVDVANADLMVIENPERLGLAQLHQLRGRVGRGAGNGFCLLMYQSPLSSLAKERLSMLRETTDGFRIAEKDLELRGPGDVMGTRQAGQIQFRLADLGRDRNLLELAVAAAQRIQTEFPEYVQPLIQRWVGGGAKYANV
jgi:ATP-dependent DNA helicase RecG